ncbi:DUF6941 family protein [Aneurinibacillus terranovensis]|uniref:DUF6941 family protein n=1 Tax=Aneurinibacillus terranovensis TaxID=278991 RepID=UPI0004807F3B|nr:hypothetical protein [Aneurinibacillus terranovensis]
MSERKPKLRYLLPFESASVMPQPNGETKAVLVQPLMNFVAPFIPTQISYQLSIGISNLDENTQYKLRLETHDPEGNLIDTQEGPFQVAKVQDNVIPSIGIMMDFRNIIINQTGEYKFILYVNGEYLGEQTLEIYEKGK